MSSNDTSTQNFLQESSQQLEKAKFFFKNRMDWCEIGMKFAAGGIFVCLIAFGFGIKISTGVFFGGLGCLVGAVSARVAIEYDKR